ncbi:MAG: nuclear transport factor 2 family protein [Anaerolineae bacterium]|nr:nuclear transport factor 2 family protein [Anaerolineae bacterium]
MTHKGGPTGAPATSVPETAVTAEIGQLLNDYFAAFNDYDVDAVRTAITDGYVLYEGGSWDSDRAVSTPVSQAYGAAHVFAFVKGYNRENKVQFERLGEPIMSGDGPWLVAQVIHMTSTDPTYPNGVDGISTLTVVDEGGTLKVARDIFVGFEVKTNRSQL